MCCFEHWLNMLSICCLACFKFHLLACCARPCIGFAMHRCSQWKSKTKCTHKHTQQTHSNPNEYRCKKNRKKIIHSIEMNSFERRKKKQKCNENKQLRLLGKQAKIFVCAHKYIWSISYDLISYSVRSNGATVCYCVCVCARAREGSLLQPMYDISECVGVASCELWCLHCILAANTRFGQSSTGKKYLYDMSQT